jgi:hypothetical protein
MKRLPFILAVLAAIALVGCNRFAGPLETREMGRADAPGYSIDEQKMRGRERYAIPEDDFRIGPKGYSDRPSPTGR